MRLQVTRRGGIAGVALAGCVDILELPASEREAAEAALHALRLGEPADPPNPDGFQYELVLIDGAGRRAILLNEADLSDALRPLVEMALARSRLG